MWHCSANGLVWGMRGVEAARGKCLVIAISVEEKPMPHCRASIHSRAVSDREVQEENVCLAPRAGEGCQPILGLD